MKNKLVPFLVILVLFLSSCAKNPINETKETSIEQTNKTNLTAIKKFKSNIDNEIQTIKTTTYENVSCENLDIVNFPNITAFYVIKEKKEKPNIEAQIELAKKCLKKWYPKGLENDILVKELRCDGKWGQKNMDNTKSYPYCFPSVLENTKKIDSGCIFFDTKNFYLSLNLDGSYGIYTMSQGKIKNLYGKKNRTAAGDMNGPESEIFKTYDIENIPNDTYPLFDKKISLKNAVNFVENYFLTQLPYKPADNIDLKVARIDVFPLKENTFCYELTMRRIFNNIPINHERIPLNHSKISDGKLYQVESERVYMIESNDIDCFVGTDASHSFTQIGKPQSKIISLKDTIDIVHKTFAKHTHISIDKIDFVYTCFYEDETVTNKQYTPFWKISAISKKDDKQMYIFVDALNGTCRYMTCH